MSGGLLYLVCVYVRHVARVECVSERSVVSRPPTMSSCVQMSYGGNGPTALPATVCDVVVDVVCRVSRVPRPAPARAPSSAHRGSGLAVRARSGSGTAGPSERGRLNESNINRMIQPVATPKLMVAHGQGLALSYPSALTRVVRLPQRDSDRHRGLDVSEVMIWWDRCRESRARHLRHMHPGRPRPEAEPRVAR